MGYNESLNLYGYVSNDPLNRWDPTGTFTCGVERVHCSEGIAQAVADLRAARDAASDPNVAAALTELVDFFGDNGVENNVNIMIGGNPDNSLGSMTIESGSVTINISSSLLRQSEGGGSLTTSRVDLASTIAHEGRHGWDRRDAGGSPASTEGGVRESEQNAFRDQLNVIRGLGAVGITQGAFIQAPPMGDQTADERWIDQNAERSTSDWCRRAANC